jgi:hypothetical protein
MELMFEGFVAIAVFGGALGIAFYRAGRRAKQRAGDGGALVGTVEQLGELLIAPLSGAPCVAYRAVARTYSAKRPDVLTNASRLRTAAIGDLRPKRTLDDEIAAKRQYPSARADGDRNGPIRVATENGDVLVDATTCHLLTPGMPLIPRKLELEQKFLARMGVDASASAAGFDESRIEVGAKIAVRGVMRDELASAREASSRIVTGDSAHPLTIDRA